MICTKKRVSSACRMAYALSTCLSLAGCGDPPKPEIVLVTKEVRFDAPAECDEARDPKWIDPPDADVKRSESARLFIANKKVTGDIKANRHICSAAIKAYDNPQPKKDASHG